MQAAHLSEKHDNEVRDTGFTPIWSELMPPTPIPQRGIQPIWPGHGSSMANTGNIDAPIPYAGRTIWPDAKKVPLRAA